MFKKWLFIGLLSGLVLPTGLDFDTHAQEAQSDAPYLYYYSDILNAFIIEHADGSDSRILGEGLMPSEVNNIQGEGWSPSGEWFAWMAGGTNAHTTHLPFQPYAVHVSGQKNLDLGQWEVSQIAWSPTEDKLLLVGTHSTLEEIRSQRFATIEVQLIDANGNTALTSLNFRESIDDCGEDVFPHFRWSDDGVYAIIYSTDFPEKTTTFYILDQAGAIQTKVMPHWICSLSSTGVIHYPDDQGSRVFHNVLTDEIWNTGFIRDGNAWLTNTTADYTLLYEIYGTAPQLKRIWLFDFIHQTYTLLQDGITDISGAYRERSWQSPDNQQVIYLGRDDVLHWFDYPTQTHVALPFIYTSMAAVEKVEWFDKDILFVNGYKSEDSFVTGLYDLRTQKMILELPNVHFDYGARFSPDKAYFVFMRDGAVVQTLATNEQVYLRPDSRGLLSTPGGKVVWHSDKNWFIIFDDALIAGGGAPFLGWTGIASANGQKRDLSFCIPDRYSDSPCIGWLPSQVDVGQLPAGQPTAILPQQYDQWATLDMSTPEFTGVNYNRPFSLYWSPDGQQLLSGIGDFIEEVPAYTLWDITTKQGQSIELNLKSFSLEKLVAWEMGNNGDFVPKVIDNPNPADAANLLPWDKLNGGDIHTFSYSPDGKLLAVGGVHSRLQIYDTQTWELLVELNLYPSAVAFSPDGKILAVGSSWEIQLWDMAELLEFGEFQREVLARE